MKVFRLVLALCLVTPALAATAGDRTASTGTVSAEFMGASGGMKLAASQDLYVMAQQEKVAEMRPTGNGCPGCTSINVAGQNSWTELVETKPEDGGAGSVYSTTFSVEEDGVSFQLMAHLARLESTIEEIVPCSGCVSGSAGVCKENQDSSVDVDARSVSGTTIIVPDSDSAPTINATCSGFEIVNGTESMTCSNSSTACTESVTVHSDELKFSFVVSGFTFSSPENKFVYGIVLKNKANSRGNLTDEEETTTTTGKAVRVKKVELPDALLVLPTTGLLKGGAEDVEVNATITMETIGSKTVINFEFDSWEEGLSLYYDPSMELLEDIISAAMYSSGTSQIVSAALAIVAALVLTV